MPPVYVKLAIINQVVTFVALDCLEGLSHYAARACQVGYSFEIVLQSLCTEQ